MGATRQRRRGLSSPPFAGTPRHVRFPAHPQPPHACAGPRPLLFALLWLAYLWASTRSGRRRSAALLLDWGALTGGPGAARHAWRALWSDGRGLRLLTALFLHADWAHLLGNLVFLLIFGLPAERAMGPWRFLLLFLLGGAVANLAAVLIIGAPHRLIIGASGAVSAVIGAYLALFPRAKLGRGGAAGAVPGIRARAGLAADRHLGAAAGRVRLHRARRSARWRGAAHIAGFAFGVLFALLVRAAIARRLRRQRGY